DQMTQADTPGRLAVIFFATSSILTTARPFSSWPVTTRRSLSVIDLSCLFPLRSGGYRLFHRIADECRKAVYPMHELAVRQHDEQRKDSAQVDSEKNPHRAGLAQGEQRQPSERCQAEQDQQAGSGAKQFLRGWRGIGAYFHPQEPGRAREQRDTAGGSQDDRRAEQRVRRNPAQIMVDG